METKIIADDLVRVWGSLFDPWDDQVEQNKLVEVKYWGDELEVLDLAENTDETVQRLRVRFYDYRGGRHREGYVKKRKSSGRFRPVAFRPDGAYVLEATFVDVQQGDATFLRLPPETPGARRKRIIIDGGEEVFAARLLASVNPGTTPDDPLIIDALVITHGDADHFEGLTAVAEAADHQSHRKRLHAELHRYFHNGLVKAPTSRPLDAAFGASRKRDGLRYAIDLHDDPRLAADPNKPFTDWAEALTSLTKNVTMPVMARVEAGDDARFDDFTNISVEVLGPITDQINGRPALRYLRSPSGAQSRSHTINGHSVVLRMRYGNVHFLFSGDLNIESERLLADSVRGNPGRTLRSEILKVPHHGSHEFDQAFLDDVNPTVSIVSSGDENAVKEHVHPRASLMAALGIASRRPLPLVFSTELSAFFAYRNLVTPEKHKGDGPDPVNKKDRKPAFFAFERLFFGAVFVRTDGTRVLCATQSAKAGVKEAYAFTVDIGGNIVEDETTML